MRDFGWSYPPGAANDPRAPWNDWGENQDDEEEQELRGEGDEDDARCRYCGTIGGHYCPHDVDHGETDPEAGGNDDE